MNANATAESRYIIRIKAHLGKTGLNWFEGFQIINLSSGEACLIGAIPDQAALHGVLRKLGSLGLPLISVGPDCRGLATADPTGDCVGLSADGAGMGG